MPIPHRPDARPDTRRASTVPLLALLVLALAPAPARALSDPPTEPAHDPAPAPSPAATDVDDDVGVPVVVTATRGEEDAVLVPAHVTLLDGATLHEARTLPDALRDEPGVLLQKTGPGQSSPYLRGFTGYQVLHLVDGIRLNNSVFRSGPNQYSGTIDAWSVDGLEVYRGPGSVLWGSDAVGGILDARVRPATAEHGWTGRWAGRWSDAERSLINRVEVEGGDAESGAAIRIGFTKKRYGTIDSGGGRLPATSWDEWDWDVRGDVPLDDGVDLAFGFQQVEQDDVPRTHKTVDAVPYHGTVDAGELYRDLNQIRKLAYARVSWEDGRGVADRGSVTLSAQQQRENQERLRTGDRFDTSGFDVHTLGAQVALETDVDHGTLSWGVELFRDEVDSFRRDFQGGALTGTSIQGPVGDDADYELLGLYVQDEIEHGDSETIVGARWSRARAAADRVDNPNVAGSDPTTPGNVISVHESFDAIVGSIRHVHHPDGDSSIWAGLSQAFRAPNLSDLTADLEDSGIEEPTPDLDPEYFLTLEAGAKTRAGDWGGEVSVWHTWIRDLIVQSPTGQVIGGTQVVQKDNVGDGYAYGVEVRAERALTDAWKAIVTAAWMASKVDQFKPDGTKIEKPLSRNMPATARLAARCEPPEEEWWFEADVLAADTADKLSLRDEGDTERIPAGGTPGFAVFGIRGGVRVGERSRVTLALENVFDKNYRYHGAGINEPGRNLVFGWDVLF